MKTEHVLTMVPAAASADVDVALKIVLMMRTRLMMTVTWVSAGVLDRTGLPYT